MKKLCVPQPPLGIDRRKGERRVLDGDPPGKHERRRGLEPRQPEVLELDMSASDWVALSDTTVSHKPSPI